ncbi:MAG: Thymidine kinase [Actinomycetia bacterium]|nr:Thymidine kinase [Actinomycetes bacterium]
MRRLCRSTPVPGTDRTSRPSPSRVPPRWSPRKGCGQIVTPLEVPGTDLVAPTSSRKCETWRLAYAGPMPETGKLEVVCGPMFSGKTDSLINRFERALANGTSVVAIKPARDGRYAADRIVSHSGRKIPACSVGSVDGVRSLGASGELVLIDEIQFFEPALGVSLKSLRNQGIEIVAVGLDRDFRREEFETTAQLVRDASSVVRLIGTCSRCGGDASLTQRLVEGTPAPLDAPRLLVGDAGLYEPRCERCWIEERRDAG